MTDQFNTTVREISKTYRLYRVYAHDWTEAARYSAFIKQFDTYDKAEKAAFRLKLEVHRITEVVTVETERDRIISNAARNG